MQTILKLIMAVTLALIGTAASFAALTHAAGPGDLDPTFGSSGVVTTTIGAGSQGLSLAVQPDGKILAAGVAGTNDVGGLALVRYTANGSLDTSFNGTGIVTSPLYIEPYHMALQTDGKILIAGAKYKEPTNPGLPVFTVLRFTAAGMPDTTFNGTGIVTAGLESSSAWSVIPRPNGKIVAVGSREVSSATLPDIYEAVVMRFNSNGSPDTTLNGTGIVTTFIDSYGDLGGLGAVQPDGKILVAVTQQYPKTGSGTHSDFATLRYKVDGSLDTTFGGTGLVTTDFDGNSGYDWPFSGVSLLPDGRIVVAGSNIPSTGSSGSIAVARYLPNGTPDTTLNGVGAITQPVTLDVSADYYNPGRMAIQPNGQIVIVGSQQRFASTPPYDITYQGGVFRLNEDGSFDASFGNAGTKKLSAGTGITYPVALQVDGKIVIGSWPGDGSPYFMIHRLLADVAPPILPVSSLLNPPDQVPLTDAQPRFDWLDAKDDFGVVSYTLTLTRTDASLTTQVTTVFTSPISEYQPTAPLPDGSYRWSVQAFDVTGSASQRVAPRSFSLQANEIYGIYLPLITKS